MKYSRPVWELMGDCAQEMPDRFRFSHVQRWFETRYPDINERTLRVHLIGLTVSRHNPNPYLAKKPPLFRRVEHGEYEVIARTPTPDDPEPIVDLPTTIRLGTDHVLLIGHEHAQRSTPAPARDLFISPDFAAARHAADAASLRWFALSSEHGLLHPDAVASPYGRRLGNESSGFRRTWASWTVAKLDSELDGLAGTTVDLRAGDEFLEPLVDVIESSGAKVRLSRGDRDAG